MVLNLWKLGLKNILAAHQEQGNFRTLRFQRNNLNRQHFYPSDSSSCSEHEAVGQQKDKESGEADTTDGDEEESETSKQKYKQTKENADDDGDEMMRERQNKSTKET